MLESGRVSKDGPSHSRDVDGSTLDDWRCEQQSEPREEVDGRGNGRAELSSAGCCIERWSSTCFGRQQLTKGPAQGSTKIGSPQTKLARARWRGSSADRQCRQTGAKPVDNESPLPRYAAIKQNGSQVGASLRECQSRQCTGRVAASAAGIIPRAAGEISERDWEQRDASPHLRKGREFAGAAPLISHDDADCGSGACVSVS
mmetsp:Transcript_12662/g.32392  ORF Transcript_12662/g.32392 Transcript_12662/m.32392 type:complete len:202 (-) Transcript_12662:3353-3958(-)